MQRASATFAFVLLFGGLIRLLAVTSSAKARPKPQELYDQYLERSADIVHLVETRRSVVTDPATKEVLLDEVRQYAWDLSPTFPGKITRYIDFFCNCLTRDQIPPLIITSPGKRRLGNRQVIVLFVTARDEPNVRQELWLDTKTLDPILIITDLDQPAGVGRKYHEVTRFIAHSFSRTLPEPRD